MTTPRTGAPELTESQSAKEEAHNEALRYIEQGAGHFIIEDRNLSAPAGSETDGQAFIVSGTGTGAWAGHDGDIAFKMNTGWEFINVAEGMTFWVKDEDKFLLATSGSTFIEFKAGGVQSVPIMAAAMTARTTSGAAAGSVELTTNKIMLATLDFDPAADEFAQFMVPMPKSWNEGTVTAQFIWTAAAGTAAQTVTWGIQAVAISNDDALDAAFGTAQLVSDALLAVNDQHTSAFTSAITIGGTPAEGDLVIFQVYRDADHATDDTLTGDAKLIGVRLNFTTNAADDS
jgi:hypothetical protein